MKLPELDSRDTIVAVSTPAGSSLRGIVRLSGPQAIAIASQAVELSVQGGVESLPRYGAAEGAFALRPEGTTAPVALFLMRRPFSYTREDVVEIQTFGSPVLLEAMVERLILLGARLAEPGEFTRRAFLNGRIDLAQAEAVRALIQARSEAAHRRALEQLAGSRSHALHALRRRLVDLCARIEVGIDFTDQDVEIIAPEAARRSIEALSRQCEALRSESRQTPVAEGIPVALFGRPNVGKSSLMNALLGARRSIVTQLPGTTRDVLEAEVILDGVTFRLVDTAGIRESPDSLEAEAVARARRVLQSAEVGLFVLDASSPISHDDLAAWQDVSLPLCMIVLNKSDQPAAVSEQQVRAELGEHPVARVSCLTGEGIEDLKGQLAEAARAGRADASAHAFEFSLRQREALRRSQQALGRAGEVLKSSADAELIAFELRQALESLSELTGELVSDDVLDRIFSEFCIGK